MDFKDREKVELAVSSDTNVNRLAMAITRIVMGEKTAKLVALGAGAVNQMTKAAAKANETLAPSGKYVVWKIYFENRVGRFPGDGPTVSGVVLETVLV